MYKSIKRTSDICWETRGLATFIDWQEVNWQKNKYSQANQKQSAQ
jgi:hypothetical protein